MNKISIKTYAKINLSLDVTEKRHDGYHNIDSIFEEISLHDVITVTQDESGIISVSCTKPDIPCNEKNIAYKAADEFFRYSGIKNTGISIHIEKNIPNEAGMGGGSTNAAGVLKILNRMFDADLSEQTLMEIGLKTGADVPFFIAGGLCYVTGTGDTVRKLSPLPEHYIAVAKGKAGISTPQAYKEIDTLINAPHHDSQKLLSCISSGNIHELMKNCFNSFELVNHPDDIEKIKSVMSDNNSVGTLMTGSGSAVFGIFTDNSSALNAANILSEIFPFSGVYTNIQNQNP